MLKEICKCNLNTNNVSFVRETEVMFSLFFDGERDSTWFSDFLSIWQFRSLV